MRSSLTEIILIVDRSGSMSSIAADMEGGLRTMVAEQAKEPGECVITYVRFDNQYEVVFVAKPAAEVELADLKIEPRGSTALLDAMAQTIDEAGHRFAAMPEAARPSKVMLIVVTDGAENASKVHTHQSVMERVKRQREVYKWEVAFLGANQDAIAVGSTLGVAPASAMTFEASGDGSRSATKGASAMASRYRSS